MIPKIITIPIEQQRFTTVGDWREDSFGFIIAITIMSNWKYEFLVLIHELTEWAICQANNISTKDCDDFDALWEEEIKSGLQPIQIEAGFDSRCPYRRGHVWGTRMERFFAFLLRVSWKDYCAECESLIECYDSSKQRTNYASV